MVTRAITESSSELPIRRPTILIPQTSLRDRFAFSLLQVLRHRPQRPAVLGGGVDFGNTVAYDSIYGDNFNNGDIYHGNPASWYTADKFLETSTSQSCWTVGPAVVAMFQSGFDIC